MGQPLYEWYNKNYYNLLLSKGIRFEREGAENCDIEYFSTGGNNKYILISFLLLVIVTLPLYSQFNTRVSSEYLLSSNVHKG